MFFLEPEQRARDLERAYADIRALREELEKEKWRQRAGVEIKIDGKTIYAEN